MSGVVERFRNSPAAQVAALIAVLTAVKAAAALQIALTGYEATYWYYAQHPAIGYFDHPAMIMWMVGASTALFGDGYLGMRMLTILAGGLTIWLTFLAGRRLYGPQAGRLAAFIMATVPMIFSIGSRLDPDSPLFLFWMAAIWALAQALSGGRPAWWYAAGAFLGLAMEGEFFSRQSDSYLQILGYFGELCVGLAMPTAGFFGYSGGDPFFVSSDYGTAFLVTAGMLNALTILDVYDIALGRKP